MFIPPKSWASRAARRPRTADSQKVLRYRRISFETLEDRRMLATAYDDVFHLVPGETSVTGDACGNDSYANSWDQQVWNGEEWVTETHYASGSFGNPAHGSVEGSMCQFTYTPNETFDGNDSFTYTISDETSSTATVTISGNTYSTNMSPEAANDDYAVLLTSAL
jgi:hypothetical protein